MRRRKSNVPKKEKWYLIVDYQDQRAALVRTAGNEEDAKTKYFEMNGLTEYEDLEHAKEHHEGVVVTSFDKIVDSPLAYHEIVIW